MTEPKLHRHRGRAWLGVWSDGTLGWVAPEHLADDTTRTPYKRGYVRPNREFYLCEITWKPVRDKRGRLIVRRAATLHISGARP